MLVIENVGLNNKVVLLCSEFASTVLSKVVVETFTDDKDVGALSNWTHVRIHSLNTVRKHGEVTSSPGVGVESNSHKKTLAFVDEWKLVVDSTPDGIGVKELSSGKSVTNSASKLSILEVVSEASTDDVDSTCTIVGCDERSDIINDALSVVMEVSESLFDTFKLDSERNRSEIVLALSMLLCWFLLK